MRNTVLAITIFAFMAAGSFTQSAQALPVTDNLRLWLDAGQGVSTVGNAVSAWNDITIGGNFVADNVSQANAGARPTFVPNAINGLPAIDFDGSNDALINGSTGLGFTGNPGATIFFVGNATSGGEDRFVAFGDTGGSRSYQLGADPSWRFNNGNNRFATTPLKNIGNFVAAFRIDAGDTYNQSEYFLNGLTPAASTGSGGGGNQANLIDDELAVGAGWFAGGAFNNLNSFLDGQIAELIVYEGGLSDEDLNAVGFFLQDKYNIDAAFISTAVPEPTTMALGLLGAAGLLARRRRAA